MGGTENVKQINVDSQWRVLGMQNRLRGLARRETVEYNTG